MTAPDVDTDTGALREALVEAARAELACGTAWHIPTGESIAAAILALPALRDLIAERGQAVAAVMLCPKCSGTGVMSRPPGVPADQPTWVSHTTGPYVCNLCTGRMVIRRALDGDQ